MKYGQLDDRHKRRSHRIFNDILTKYSCSKCPKILDVGCAFGVIGALRGVPENVFGIERDPDLALLAEKNCHKVYRVDLDDFDPSYIKESGFDFIFCGDIIEHLLDPAGLIKKLSLLLSERGYMIISVPNIAQFPFRLKLLFGNFDYEETGVLDKTHLHLYTYKTAVSLIKKANLEIIRFFPSGTFASYLNVLPKLLASQLIFLCRKKSS
jgi:2-polyprenyl-3-methyl-5-hydroxy-6-metoxy-1,4-benzoquinol methylase